MDQEAYQQQSEGQKLKRYTPCTLAGRHERGSEGTESERLGVRWPRTEISGEKWLFRRLRFFKGCCANQEVEKFSSIMLEQRGYISALKFPPKTDYSFFFFFINKVFCISIKKKKIHSSLELLSRDLDKRTKKGSRRP